MAASDSCQAKPWAIWLRERLRERGWEAAEITRRTGGQIGSPSLSRWLDSKRDPDVASIRRVCAALGVPMAEGLIGAGLVEPHEVGVTVTRPPERSLGAVAAVLEEVAELIRATADLEGSTENVMPFARDDAPRVEPQGLEGVDWAALDRRKK